MDRPAVPTPRDCPVDDIPVSDGGRDADTNRQRQDRPCPAGRLVEVELATLA